MRTIHALLATALALPALAQEYSFELLPKSSMRLESGVTVQLPGTLIGNYDPDQNPEGTLTRPGLIGGSGNQPVDATMGLSNDALLEGAPAGGFELAVHLEEGSAELSGLELDLLGGNEGSGATSLHLEFETFRSFNPDSFYLGDFPIDLPLGEQVLRDLHLVQVAPSQGGSLSGSEGHYQLDLLVPTELSFVLVVGENETPIGPLPLLLPLSGELSLLGDGAELVFGVDLKTFQEIVDPLPGFQIEDAPLDLPTVLPPGETAHLLWNAVIESILYELQFNLDAVAGADAPCGFESYCVASPNSTGQGAVLLALGSASLSENQLTFVGSSLPAGQFAYLMMARERAEVPFFRGSQGTLCLAMPVLKFTPHVMPIDGGGMVEIPVDYQNLPPGIELLAGESWDFQLWYRDLNPGVVTNTSSAIEVLFCN